MEYTIQKLAELAGVTTRTLRWYLPPDVYAAIPSGIRIPLRLS